MRQLQGVKRSVKRVKQIEDQDGGCTDDYMTDASLEEEEYVHSCAAVAILYTSCIVFTQTCGCSTSIFYGKEEENFPS